MDCRTKNYPSCTHTYLTDLSAVVWRGWSQILFCGVPQCSVHAPLLFIIYVNDLQDVTRTCDLSVSAGDTHLTSALKKFSDLNTEILPEFIEICNRLQANKLSFNVVKTEYMIIGIEQSIIQLVLSPVIKVVNKYPRKVNKPNP